MDEIFFLIKFIIFMSNPDLSNLLDNSCFCFNEIPFLGTAIRELPPPEIKKITRSSGFVLLRSLIAFSPACKLFLFGTGCEDFI